MLAFTEALNYLKDNTEELELKYNVERDGIGYWSCEAYLSREDLDPDNFQYCIHIGYSLDDKYEVEDDAIVETMQFAVIDTQLRFQIAVAHLAARGIPTRKKVQAACNDLLRRKIYKREEVIEALNANEHFNQEWVKEHSGYIIESLGAAIDKTD